MRQLSDVTHGQHIESAGTHPDELGEQALPPKVVEVLDMHRETIAQHLGSVGLTDPGVGPDRIRRDQSSIPLGTQASKFRAPVINDSDTRADEVIDMRDLHLLDRYRP